MIFLILIYFILNKNFLFYKSLRWAWIIITKEKITTRLVESVFCFVLDRYTCFAKASRSNKDWWSYTVLIELRLFYFRGGGNPRHTSPLRKDAMDPDVLKFLNLLVNLRQFEIRETHSTSVVAKGTKHKKNTKLRQ